MTAPARRPLLRARALAPAVVVASLAAGVAVVPGVVAAPAGAATPSTTLLAVDGVTVPEVVSGHGDDLTLTAQVAVDGAVPAGWVFFVVDGLSRRADVGPGGVAVTPLTTDLPAGVHQLSATFVPADPAQQDGSTSATTSLRVVEVATKPRVRLRVQRAGHGVRVRTRVRAPYGTTPTGTVRVTLRRLGESWRWTRRGDLEDAAATVVSRPRRPFAPGRYHVVVRYVGDDDHLASRKGHGFRIGRR